MMPTIRPTQVFPMPCETYTAHLGPRQAEAFTLLWGIADAADVMTDADGASWLVTKELAEPDGTALVPPDLAHQLFAGVRFVETMPSSPTLSQDTAYVSALYKIATWEHETVRETMEAFVHTLYE